MTLDLNRKTLIGAVATLLCALCCFFALDGFVRWMNPVASTNEWGFIDLQEKLELLDKHYKKHGRIDVLSVGSSAVSCVDAGLWQRATNDEVVCFNLGVGGVHPEHVEFYLANYVIGKYKPKHVVFMVQARSVLKRRNLSPPFTMAFWDSRQVKRLSAQEPLARLANGFDELSYFSQRKGILRSAISTSGAKTAPGYIDQRMDEFGLLNERTWKITLLKDVRHDNVDSIDITESMGALARIAVLCRKNNITFDLANEGFIPDHWSMYSQRTKDDYENLLRLAAGEDCFYNIASIIPLTNEDFYDSVHMNGWGMEKADLFMFNKILSPKYFGGKYQVEPAVLLPFASATNKVSGDLSVGKTSHLAAGEYQVIADAPGGQVLFGEPIAPGRYEVNVWAYTELKSPVESHKVCVRLFDSATAEVLSAHELELPTHLIPYLPVRTMVDVPAGAVGALSVEVLAVAPHKRLMLDLLSVRRLETKNIDPLKLANEATTKLGGIPRNTSLVLNSNFTKPDESTNTVAFKWANYGGDASIEDDKLRITASPVQQWVAAVENNAGLFGRKLKFTYTASGTQGASLIGSVYYDNAGATDKQRVMHRAAPKGTANADGTQLFEVEFVLPDTVVSGLTVDFRLNYQKEGQYALISDVKLLVEDDAK